MSQKHARSTAAQANTRTHTEYAAITKEEQPNNHQTGSRHGKEEGRKQQPAAACEAGLFVVVG